MSSSPAKPDGGGATARPKAIIVGTGFGCRIQLPALRGAGFSVEALVGSDPERTGERAEVNGVPASFTDLAAAIDRTGADLVAISAPPHAHAALTLTALERGCDVLCEKPFAADVAEAEVMLAAARRAGRFHAIGHELRFDPPRAVLRQAIASGMIGEPRLASIVLLLPQLRTQASEMPDWWFDPAKGGGWLGALGSHLIDQLRWWLGEIGSVSAQVGNLAGTCGAADDAFTIRFQTTGGLQGVLQSSAGAWGPPLDVTRVCGSEGTLRIEQGRVFFSGRDGERELPVPPELALPPMPDLNSDPRHRTDRWKGLVAVELRPYTALCRSIRTLLDGTVVASGPIEPATFVDGVACMRVMDAIRLSAAKGGGLTTV